MERNGLRIIMSLLLVGFGVLLLLNNMGMLPIDITDREWFWMLAFGAGGLAFLAAFATNTRENWWAAIPGFTLLGLGLVIGSATSGFLAQVGGAIFLGMIGLSFLVIYAIRREFWWAVIPAGVMATLSGVVVASELVAGQVGGAVFFIGLALTFLVVYLLPTREGRMFWAIWPAGILGLMGVLLLAGATNMARYIWPLAIIVAGGLLVFRSFVPRGR